MKFPRPTRRTGKRTGKDRGRFFLIAMGSIRECQAVTELEPEAFNHQTRDLLDHLAASVYKLTRTTTNCATGNMGDILDREHG